MIEFQQRHIVTQTRPEGIKEYLHFAATIASGLALLGMVISSVYALGQVMGHTIVAFIMATLVVGTMLVLMAACWMDYIPEARRRH